MTITERMKKYAAIREAIYKNDGIGAAVAHGVLDELEAAMHALEVARCDIIELQYQCRRNQPSHRTIENNLNMIAKTINEILGEK